MLNLLKYENKCVFRHLFPFYVSVLIMSIIGAFSYGFYYSLYEFLPNWLFSTFLGLGGTAFIVLQIAMFVITFLVILQRFHFGILGDEGYMMHMLPVSTAKLLWSKLFAAILMTISTAIVCILSIAIMFTSDFFPLVLQTNWWNMLQITTRHIPSWPILLIQLIIVLILVVASGISLMYLSMSIGHQAGKHKILMSFVAYLVIYNAVGVFLILFLYFLGVIGVANNLIYLISYLSEQMQLHLFGVAMTVFYAILFAVYFGVSIAFVKRKLNLE